MKTAIKIIALFCLSCLSFSLPLIAAGPIDGEVSAIWWANDIDTKSEAGATSADAGAPGLRAELRMFERYGLRADQSRSDADGAGADYTNVDFMWRALAPSENNFVAVGLGWQRMDIDGFASDISGVRVSVGGRVELPAGLYAYGHGSYLPSLQDADSENPVLGEFKDLDAHEYELGVAWEATPVIRVHAGYRVNRLSFTQDGIPASGGGAAQLTPEAGGDPGLQELAPSGPGPCDDCSSNAISSSSSSGETESAGFYLGVGFKF